jgi:hypothetical protein
MLIALVIWHVKILYVKCYALDVNCPAFDANCSAFDGG